MKERLIGSCVIGQSGGPTAVINASTYGVVQAALAAPEITAVLGAEYGIMGVLNDRLFDLGQEDEYELSLLMNTPASELGSCRYRLESESDLQKILETFRKYNVRYFFLNGGNDSMDTCVKIERYLLENDYECRILGVPKTIDNDLFGTDHCPGYGSAAKYIATTCMEISKDTNVYDIGTVTVVEIMGRHAGWLAGAAALGNLFGSGPDLCYLPEVEFDLGCFLRDIKAIYDKTGKVLIAVSEGIHDSAGTFISQYAMGSGRGTQDAFGHTQLGGLAAYLAHEIKLHTDAKVRGIELSLLQRCAGHCVSKTDLDEAYEIGGFAVQCAISGVSGKMIGIERDMSGGNYAGKMVLAPLTDVANLEKKVPRDWINEEGNNVNEKFFEYALPLIQGEPKRVIEQSMPRYSKLKKVLAECSPSREIAGQLATDNR